MFSASLGLGTLESCLLLFSLLLCHFFHPLLQREEGPLQTQNYSCHWEDVSYLWQENPEVQLQKKQPG